MGKGFTAVELLLVLVCIGMVGYFIAQPYFEMKTFNKFSETKANYFDAVFARLRVISK